MGERDGVAQAPVGAFATRLVVLAVVFGLAVVSEVGGGGLWSEREIAALYALVLVGFLLSLAYGALSAWSARGPRVRMELAGDGLWILAVLHCTGGVGSAFGFLYVVWIVHAALAAGPRAAVVALGGASLGYGVLALGPVHGWFPAFDPATAPAPESIARSTGVHLLAYLCVTLLARHLAAEIQSGRSELRELGEIHRRIVDNIATGLVSVDRDGAITSFNGEAERITGFESAEVIGQALREVLPVLAAAVEPDAERSVSRGRATLVERLQVDLLNRDEVELHLGLSASALFDSKGARDGAVLIFQDLTRVVEMEERLHRSERLSAVGQLAAGLAHEVRNPLASLSGAVELLCADLPEGDGDGASRRLGDIVVRETGRLNRLVGEFLTYARPGAGELHPVDLAAVLSDIEELAAHSDDDALAGVRLVVDAPPEARVCGNADQLRQVVWNLVLNAAQAKPADGRVRVSCRPCEGGVTDLRVSDTGSGIPLAVLDRVLEPFFTTRASGTGLGLAAVYRVVEAHGGELEICSEPGEGTRVRVLLRSADTQAAGGGADAAQESDPWHAS